MKKTVLFLAISASFGLAGAQALAVPNSSERAVTAVSSTTAPSDAKVNPFTGLKDEMALLDQSTEGLKPVSALQVSANPERVGNTRTAPKAPPIASTEGCPPLSKEGTAESANAKSGELKDKRLGPLNATSSKIAGSSAGKPYKPRGGSSHAAARTSEESDYVGLTPGTKICPGYYDPKPTETVVPVASHITLLSVIEYSGVRSAIMSIAGTPVVVQEGGVTSSGVVHIADASSVTVGGTLYRVVPSKTTSPARLLSRQP
jgi:hypothetical protein